MVEAVPGRVEVEAAVAFGRAGGRDLRCDVFTPPGGPPGSGSGGATGLLLVHGGGWREGDRADWRRYGIRLARAGVVCAAIDYRLLPEAPWPAAIHDVKAAIRWMRANADALGVDPDRIAVAGNSAGGHLALLAAGTPGLDVFEGDGGHPGVSSAVAAAIALYPVTDFAGARHEAYRFLFDGVPASERATAARAASPVAHVSATHPPALLIHGVDDAVVPVAHSTAMYDALRAAGVPAELHLYAGQAHVFDSDLRFARHCADLMALFLDRYPGGRGGAARGEDGTDAGEVATSGPTGVREGSAR